MEVMGTGKKLNENEEALEYNEHSRPYLYTLCSSSLTTLLHVDHISTILIQTPSPLTSSHSHVSRSVRSASSLLVTSSLSPALL